jgi:hypothetical protein
MPRTSRVVEAALLSDHIDRQVDFLKIDIEGDELAVVRDLANSDKLRHVSQMMIEYHHHVRPQTDEFSVLLRLLEDAGFGYQCQARLDRPLRPRVVQDVLIYAYRKSAFS